MPEPLIKQLYMEDSEPFMHKYVVTENGMLMIPWYDFIDPHDDKNDLTCATVNDIEYYDANDLMMFGLEEYRDTLKSMISIMLNFHRDRFDQQRERAEG